MIISTVILNNNKYWHSYVLNRNTMINKYTNTLLKKINRKKRKFIKWLYVRKDLKYIFPIKKTSIFSLYNVNNNINYLKKNEYREIKQKKNRLHIRKNVKKRIK